MMRIFVTGAGGRVARALREAAEGMADVVIGHGARPRLDLTRPDTVLPVMEAFGPDVVVNAAAYTAVDQAESEPDLAYAINRDGARAVAAAAARLGAPVVQLSTDYVFDGTKAEPYVESDEAHPLSVYGASKLAAEWAVADANPRHVILRTAWVYAPFGASFPRTVLRLASEGARLRIVDDQIGCPTYAPDIAQAILAIVRTWKARGWRDGDAGVTHLAGPDAVTWCGLARQVLAAAGVRGASVEAITTADYPTAATRPANSRLSTQRLAAHFAITLPGLDESLRACVERLTAETMRLDA